MDNKPLNIINREISLCVIQCEIQSDESTIWVKFSNEFAYFVVLCSLARWHYYQYKYLNRVYFN